MKKEINSNTEIICPNCDKKVIKKNLKRHNTSKYHLLAIKKDEENKPIIKLEENKKEN